MTMLRFRAPYFGALVAAASLVAFTDGQADAEQASSSPLQLELKIFLGDVEGRIDHMAIDLPRKRLFVAELGNNAVGIVDLEGHKVVHTIGGLKEPQGVAYVPSTDTLFVTNAGDGSVRLFRGSDYEPAGQLDLGADADNIRVDAAANRVFVGHGDGALATIDLATNGKVADIPLHAHPESFQLARSTRRIFVNVPKAREIAVIDRFAGKQTASWPVENDSNFPMALDEKSERILVAFRRPAQLGVFSMRDGNTIATIDVCGDADDLFFDDKRQHVYLSCGDGYLDVFEPQENSYHRAAHIPTISGARTSLFVPEIDRLFVAARANPGEPAAIWVFRPAP
jgi:YVTN family beta-propeller protein